MSELNASAVKKMKVADLRSELTKRGLESKGLKQVLVDRLLAALEDDQPVEMATEVKEEPVESTEESTAVAENGEGEKTEPIADVSEQPPEELMAEDTTVSAEQNVKTRIKQEKIEDAEAKYDVKVKVEEPEAMESDSKVDETVKIKTEKDEENNDSIVDKLTPEAREDKSEEHKQDYEKESEPLLDDEEEKDETDDSTVVLSRYISDLYFKISPDGLTGNVITDEGFTYIWAGAKATWGVNKGKVGYECKVLKNVDNDLPSTEEPRNGVRIGWSVGDASLQLGEEGLSYGYENTGKSCTSSEFSEYGSKFTQGDVIGCYLDLDSDEATISYTKNGEDLGVAFTISSKDFISKPLYPHIIVKNTECQINAGAQKEPWFPCKEGYTLIQQVGNENLVEGQRGPKQKKDCEVLMMVGLPASGKTTWVNQHVEKEKDKRYNIIGTNSVMVKMKVNGEERKRSSENYDKLMEKATKCLRRIFELAPTKKRNYILDQTNVHPNAQKRKMESFMGFKRTAIVVCPKPEELEKRTKEKKEKKGFEVPEFALNDMKANFTLPRVGLLLNEVKFIEENEEESTKIVAEYKRKARSSNERGSNSYRRRDHGQKGSGRFHPYKRDDQRSNRGGGGGNRDRRSGGRGGSGGSNYGRQHGGSHDRRSGGGYNKGNQNYSKGGNRSGGNRGGGNFQKNFQYQQQQQQQQQQRYASYAAAPQYSFPQQPAYPFPNPYQQPRPAYPIPNYQQQQQAFYYQQQAQQNFYQQAGYGQQPYGQYPRRY